MNSSFSLVNAAGSMMDIRQADLTCNTNYEMYTMFVLIGSSGSSLSLVLEAIPNFGILCVSPFSHFLTHMEVVSTQKARGYAI